MKESVVIKDFQGHLRATGKSQNTIKVYTYYLLEFFRILCEIKRAKSISNIVLFNVTEEDIFIYLYHISREKNNKSKITRLKITVIRKFYKWLLINNPEIENPTTNIFISIKGSHLPKVLSLEQAIALQKIYEFGRNNLIMQIFLQTGLRINELSNLKVKKIDFTDNSIFVLGKGEKERKIFINSGLADTIKKYVEKCQCKDYLFEGKSNGHISNSEIRYIVYNAYKMLGIGDRGYTVHTLRHTFASIMYQHTKDILLVKEILGHDVLLSTQIYIHINPDNVKSAVDKNPLNY